MIRAGRALTILEKLLMVIGATLLIVCAVALAHRSLASRIAMRAFDEARAAAGPKGGAYDALPQTEEGYVDFALWSEKRVRAYRDSLTAFKGAPLAILHIARLGIRVPVVEGTDELALNRGAGWIAGTAHPGEDGNVGIAGHRDGFFRRLKDAAVGDTFELITLRSTRTYIVDQIEIVYPDNVGVLQPREVPSVTLVTCYPFYFLGDAPQRFILHASLKR